MKITININTVKNKTLNLSQTLLPAKALRLRLALSFLFLFSFFLSRLYFFLYGSFRLTAKARGGYRDFPRTPCPHTCTASLVVNTTTGGGGAFDKPTLTHHYHPKCPLFLKKRRSARETCSGQAATALGPPPGAGLLRGLERVLERGYLEPGLLSRLGLSPALLSLGTVGLSARAVACCRVFNSRDRSYVGFPDRLQAEREEVRPSASPLHPA